MVLKCWWSPWGMNKWNFYLHTHCFLSQVRNFLGYNFTVQSVQENTRGQQSHSSNKDDDDGNIWTTWSQSLIGPVSIWNWIRGLWLSVVRHACLMLSHWVCRACVVSEKARTSVLSETGSHNMTMLVIFFYPLCILFCSHWFCFYFSLKLFFFFKRFHHPNAWQLKKCNAIHSRRQVEWKGTHERMSECLQ